MLRRIRAVQAAQGWDLNVCSHGSTEIHSWPHADFAHFWTGTSSSPPRLIDLSGGAGAGLGFRRALLARNPDGHALRLVEPLI